MSDKIEFIGKLKRTITLNDDEVSIETKGWAQKTQGIPSVTFEYKDIKSIEITDATLWHTNYIEFKVTGSSSPDDTKRDLFGTKQIPDSPYIVMFKSQQKDELKNIHSEILKRMKAQKSNQVPIDNTGDIPSQIKKTFRLERQWYSDTRRVWYKEKRIIRKNLKKVKAKIFYIF